MNKQVKGFMNFVRTQGVVGLAVGLAIGTQAGKAVGILKIRYHLSACFTFYTHCKPKSKPAGGLEHKNYILSGVCMPSIASPLLRV